MPSIPAVLQARLKAIVGAVLAAVALYLTTAVTTGNTITLDGLIAALLGGLGTGLGVHATVNKVSAKARAPKTGHTVYRRHIPETPVAGKPLGRHVHHDSRSLDYLVPKRRSLRKMGSYSWTRDIPVLDQGNVGSCTGNAATGCIGTQPNDVPLAAKIAAKQLVLDEAEALKLYSAAETIDGNGTYPPNDDGSSGLSVAKAALNAGLIAGYTHITSIAAAQTAIAKGPFIIGSNWYTGMDSPNAAGVVTATGTVRGGHEYECTEYDAVNDLWWCDNSWGPTFGVKGRFAYSTATFKKLLSEDGDATQFVPLAAPAPTPTPTPAETDLVVSNTAMVEHIDALAAAKGQTPEAFLLARLQKIYPTAK
jgi:hypothetical protein